MSGTNSTVPRRAGGTLVRHLRALLPRFLTVMVARYSFSYTHALRSTTVCSRRGAHGHSTPRVRNSSRNGHHTCDNGRVTDRCPSKPQEKGGYGHGHFHPLSSSEPPKAQCLPTHTTRTHSGSDTHAPSQTRMHTDTPNGKELYRVHVDRRRCGMRLHQHVLAGQTGSAVAKLNRQLRPTCRRAQETAEPTPFSRRQGTARIA
jgi:hypothetical protein